MDIEYCWDGLNSQTIVPQKGHVVYVYDGDGNLVKSVIGDVVTYYPNGVYELKVSGSNEVVTKYYSAGASRIAYRINGTITWLLNDHLGSTTGLLNSNGELVGTLKYTAYGEIRSGSSSTDYRYTGQREESEIGLYYYVARFYDPTLGRFISADTIIPNPGSNSGYDRYGYVTGNPIKITDPSGHSPSECGSENQECNTVMVILICGIATGDNCSNELPVEGYGENGESALPLEPYKEWAVSNGYAYRYFDTNGTKFELSENITSMIYENPSYSYMLIGHSAGADVATLVGSGLSDEITVNSMILLDPTLTASPDYLNVGDMSPLLDNIMHKNIPLVFGDTIPYQNPEKSDNINLADHLTSDIAGNIISFDNLSHLQLANNNYAFQKIMLSLFYGWQ